MIPLMTYLHIASFLGASAVIAGAFGAHGLEGSISASRLETFETAAFYHLIHAVALLILSLQDPRLFTWAKRFFVAGTLIFSGSLYLLVLTDTPWLGAITPIGGVCFIVGWISIGFGSGSLSKKGD